jgi:hypothetical protein
VIQPAVSLTKYTILVAATVDEPRRDLLEFAKRTLESPWAPNADATRFCAFWTASGLWRGFQCARRAQSALAVRAKVRQNSLLLRKCGKASGAQNGLKVAGRKQCRPVKINKQRETNIALDALSCHYPR